MDYQPTWKERLEDAKVYRGPAIAGLVVLALGGWLVWHELVPRQKAKQSPAVVTKDEAVREQARQRLSGQVEVLEKTYRRAIDAGEGDAAIAKLLDRVIARQGERTQLDPAGNTPETERLAELEAERGMLRTRVFSARSLTLEREAQAAPGTADALVKLREALRLQRDANAAATTARAKNLQRETQLAHTVAQAEAEPTRAALATVLTLVRAAQARDQRDTALKQLTEARRLQAELTRLYPQTAYGTPARLEEIDAEIESLRAAGLAETSKLREAEGDAAARADRTAEAAAAYAAAAALQRELNEKFARSSFVSVPRGEQLETKRQTILSAATWTQAVNQDREIALLLQRRVASAAGEKITATLALVEKAAAEFPRSTAIDAKLRNRLAYLALRASEIDAIQQQVLAQLAPLPSSRGLVMLKTEVPQELYTRIMNANPSRNSGRALPMDSVSWTEAQEFCRRLGWLLATRVRLPSEAGAWSAATSGGQTRDVGKSPATTTGFVDLAGNVAEWLQGAKDTDPLAPVAGGSYLDAAEALRECSVVVLEKRERARHVGFRVVVVLPAP
jgi:formylglycine-generating enzyme required for sulfatase activity